MKIKTDDEEFLVLEYFRLIKENNIDGLLNLFTNDAVIYEPFSRLSAEGGEGLRDRTAMKAFLQVSAMANDGLQLSIILQESRQVKQEHSIGYNIDRLKAENSSTITALVRFKREKSAIARFVFEAVKCPVSNILTQNEEGGKNTLKTWKIKSLNIEFLN